MRNLSFTLDLDDVGHIADVLSSRGGNDPLVSMFNMLLVQGKPLKIQACDDEIELTMNELINDLGLELRDDDIQEANFETPPKEDKPNGITPYSIPGTNWAKTEDVPEFKEPEPEPNKVLAGWDDRVPRPVPDPELIANQQASKAGESVTQPQPVPEQRVFSPVPNDVSAEPKVNMGHPGLRPSGVPLQPEPVKTPEPDFDGDYTCEDCGGFLSCNPHSDPKMNCDCPPVEPTPPDNWSTGVAPNTGQSWTTS